MYQVYKEDQDQISGATYISDAVFFTKKIGDWEKLLVLFQTNHLIGKPVIKLNAEVY